MAGPRRAGDRERRRQERRSQRQARLLEAALDLIAVRGLNDTTVDDVVAAARTSKSSFYEFWASREELVARVLEERGLALLEAVSEAASQGSDHRARMRAGLERFVFECSQDHRFTRLLLVESVGVSPAVSAVREEIQDAFSRMIETEARASALADPLHDEVDPALFARALVGAAEEATAHLLDTGERETRRVVRGLSAIFVPGPAVAP